MTQPTVEREVTYVYADEIERLRAIENAARLVSQWADSIGSGPIEELNAELQSLWTLTHPGMVRGFMGRGEPVGSYPPCRVDLLCYRNDGHDGRHMYPTDRAQP